MPKIVHITTVPQSLIFLTGQVGFMQQQGLEIEAISSPGDQLTAFGKAHDVVTHAIDMPRRISPGADLLSLSKMISALKNIRPDLVHAHTPKGGLLGMIAATAAGVPRRVYHMRGLPMVTATGNKRMLLTWTERVSCALAHEVICVSHSLRQVAIEEKLCPPHKMHVMLGGSGNGVDAATRFNPERQPKEMGQSIRELYGIPQDAVVVGFIGRLVQDKGILELTRAWRKITQSHPNAHLLIVGPFESRDAVPKDIVKTLQNTSSIHLAGFQKDTPAFYTAMDIVVLPTYREGFPNVPLEAAAMGLPVVATAIPGCTDAVDDGNTGLLVPVQNSDALAEAIITYLDDPDLRQTHGRRGRERVLADFAPEGIWRGIYALYQTLLAR